MIWLEKITYMPDCMWLMRGMCVILRWFIRLSQILTCNVYDKGSRGHESWHHIHTGACLFNMLIGHMTRKNPAQFIHRHWSVVTSCSANMPLVRIKGDGNDKSREAILVNHLDTMFCSGCSLSCDGSKSYCSPTKWQIIIDDSTKYSYAYYTSTFKAVQ